MENSARLTGLLQKTDFGLVAWLESTRLILPLRAVDCRFEVRGDLLSVSIDQVFHQNNAQALDCLYTFPLPAGAAVYRCEMHVNGRVVYARVEEETRARELAAEHKAAGHRTALVEMVRENLFTLSLGNLQPEDQVVVRLAYFQTLTRLSDWSSFHIPFCPGVKFIPGNPLLRSAVGKGAADDTDRVPDASRISPPRMPAGSSDAASLFIQGIVDDPSRSIQELSSPSHPIIVRDGLGTFTIGLAQGCSVPDQDFVLRWTEPLPEEVGVAAWSWTSAENQYAMVRIMPPAVEADEGRGEEQPQIDRYFLLDHSGSMQGLKWEKTAQAFVGLLRGMKAEDLVWLTLFNSGFRDFAEKPLAASRLLQDRQALNLESHAPGGGTEVLPALRHVLQKMQEFSPSRPAIVVLITDGQIGNEEEVLRMLRQRPDVTLHVLGIDTAPNDAFLKALSEQHGGSWHQMHPNDDLAGTVKRLASRLRPAVLGSLEVSPGWEVASCPPAKVYAGQKVALLLRRPNVGMKPGLEISARRSDGAEWRASLQHALPAGEAIEKLWHQLRIDECIQRGELGSAIALAKAANLICQGASFIAWDETEKVMISNKDVYQTSLSLADNLSSLVQMDRYVCCCLEPTHALCELSLGDDCDDRLIEWDGDATNFRPDMAGLPDPKMRLQLNDAMVAAWRPELGLTRQLWTDFVNQLMAYCGSLTEVERSSFHEVIERVLGGPGSAARLDVRAVRGLLAWFEGSVPLDYPERAEALRVIGEIRTVKCYALESPETTLTDTV